MYLVVLVLFAYFASNIEVEEEQVTGADPGFPVEGGVNPQGWGAPI